MKFEPVCEAQVDFFKRYELEESWELLKLCEYISYIIGVFQGD